LIQARKAGAKLFRDVAAEYGIDDAAGLALLTSAAESLDALRAAQAAIKEHGLVCLDRYGSPKANPACGIAKDARNGLLAALKQLNLDLEPLRDGVGRPGRPLGWRGPNGGARDAH
jgi:phage terminase small subunit